MSLETMPKRFLEDPANVPREMERPLNEDDFERHHVTQQMRDETDDIIRKGTFASFYEAIQQYDERAEMDTEQLAETWWLLKNMYASKRRNIQKTLKEHPQFEFPGEREMREELYAAFADYDLGFERWWNEHPRDDEIAPWDRYRS